MRGTVSPVCMGSKHGVGGRRTVLSSGSVRPPPAILVAGVVNLAVTFPCRLWGKECYLRLSICLPVRASPQPCLAVSLFFFLKLERLRPFGPTPEGRCGGKVAPELAPGALVLTSA